ncbi:uncharacterized protein [Dysidea avara]|uniref:uncharacterized protein n=1 Tax=Dysidea avara TaxID=196820 RepID=UPI00332BD48A
MASYLFLLTWLAVMLTSCMGNHMYSDQKPLAETNPFDRMVLDYLYKYTYDSRHVVANWTNWGNSSSTSDPCTDNWYGITCVEDQSVYYVSGIDLPHHLIPVLPSEIYQMKHLKTLILTGNYLEYSNFQTGLFTMQTLEVLDISMITDLNITLPTRLEMANLQYLYAYDSQLNGPLPETWNTPKLQGIVLNDNYLTGQLPVGISKITGLKQLMLQNNKLFGNFPPDYGNLHQLTDLSLVQLIDSTPYRRLCSFLPSSWETMFSLVNVSLCAFGDIPDYIGDTWSQLRLLSVKGGGLNDRIPESICKLTELQILDLSSNKLEGTIPDCIFKMSSLTHLDLSNNLLSGHISEAIGDLTNIEQLLLYRNRFNGTLPRNAAKLVNINMLAFENNMLIGELPSEYDILRNVARDHKLILYFDGNMLSSIGDGLEYLFSDVFYIGLYDNPLECPLPPYVNYAKCSLCNSGTKRNNCEYCVSAGCGWCSYGNNCIEGTHQGPLSQYTCPEGHWSFQTCGENLFVQ